MALTQSSAQRAQSRIVRARKANVERALGVAIEALEAEGRPVRILDVACGGGRYVLDVLATLRRTDGIEQTVVVASEASVEFATERDVVVLEDEHGDGQSAATLIGVPQRRQGSRGRSKT